MNIAGVVVFSVCLLQTKALIFAREKCYRPYGCFNNRKPFHNAAMLLPKSPTDQNIQFMLYTRQNPTSEQILKDGDLDGVKASNFDPSQNTKIIIHGFLANGRASWIKNMTSELLKKEDCNVIAVDWEHGAKRRWYSIYDQASVNTRVAGVVTAELVKTLVKAGTSLDNVHLIGHSLGAHTAGYAGERLPGLGRITGLDPAGPNFEYKDKRVRLDPSDAVFVDVIHTDSETLLDLAFGMKTPVGTVDFYPDGGYDQPGCPANAGGHLINTFTGDLVEGIACSHGRSIAYFTASINGPCTFKAYPCCNSLVDMKFCTTGICEAGCSNLGYNINKTAKGTFYVDVTGTPPYC